MKQEDFIRNNIKAELVKIGHSEVVAAQCADSAKQKYLNGSNWPMGKVFDVLLKDAKKAAGKVKKLAEKRKGL